MDSQQRCQWVGIDPLYLTYHDNEWGVPSYDDRHLFECLMLEAMQSGLSWLTILKKRENYRQTFYNFVVEEIVYNLFDATDELMLNAGIVRHRLKINAIIHNAKQVMALNEKEGSFSDFLWSFVDGKILPPSVEPRSSSIESKNMGRALKEIGFKFVGEITCYSFMQSVGMINDHSADCFRR